MPTAASRIRWSSEENREKPDPGHILILAKTIDKATLADLATRYAMQELRLATPRELVKDGYILLRSPSENVVGKLTWKNRSPGERNVTIAEASCIPRGNVAAALGSSWFSRNRASLFW